MTTVDRSEFKHPEHELHHIYQGLIKSHVVADHTANILRIENNPKICSPAIHFAAVDFKFFKVYIEYETYNWLIDGIIQSSIRTITVFTDWYEYEAVRLKKLHSAIGSNGVSLN